MAYFSGKGKLWIGQRDVLGGPGKGLVWVGNVPSFEASMEAVKLEHKESYTGQNLTDVSIITEKKAKLVAQLEDFNSYNLALLFNGTTTDVTGTAVIGAGVETIVPSAANGGVITVGGLYPLKYQDVTAVVLKDGALATITSTKYSVNAQAGSIEFNNTIGAPTLPITAEYTRNTFRRTVMFNASQVEYYVRFEGLNTANLASVNQQTVVELYRVQWDPVTAFGIINDDIAQFTLNGNVLADPVKALDGEFGSFGRIMDMAT